MNLNVINKSSDRLYKVYDITYNKAGYPHFLVYKDGQWVRMSAKHFEPYDNSANSFDKLISETFKSYYEKN